MKQSSSFIICILTVAALLANVACNSKPKPIDITINTKPPEKEREVGERVTFHRPVKPEKTPPSFYCSHRIGSTTSAEDTIKLTYKTDTIEIDYTITMKTNGGYEIKGNGNIQPAILRTGDTLELCWGVENCLVMKKNKDRTWTIESLPFVK